MVERPHDNPVSPERLGQIAQRRLAQLGISVQGDGTKLAGELAFRGGRVAAQGIEPIRAASFAVVDHDGLAFRDPPLRALGKIPFFDVSSAEALEERIGQILRWRVDSLARTAGLLTTWGVSPVLDPERLRLIAAIRTIEQTFELSVGTDGARVRRLLPLHGVALELPEDGPLFQLTDYPAAIDLELELSHRVDEFRQAASVPRPTKENRATLTALPTRAEALTLPQLLAAFGDAEIVLGPGTEIHRDFTMNDRSYHFVARHDSGKRFRGRVTSDAGEKWSDTFEIEAFPGLAKLMELVLSAPAEDARGAVSTAPQPAGSPAIQAGEIWVMNILVESDNGQEVRYTSVNAEGRLFGTTRVIAKRDFDELFAKEHGAFRLRIVIERLDKDAVWYRQLDHSGQARGPQRSVPTGAVLSNFVPEGSSY